MRRSCQNLHPTGKGRFAPVAVCTYGKDCRFKERMCWNKHIPDGSLPPGGDLETREDELGGRCHLLLKQQERDIAELRDESGRQRELYQREVSGLREQIAQLGQELGCLRETHEREQLGHVALACQMEKFVESLVMFRDTQQRLGREVDKAVASVDGLAYDADEELERTRAISVAAAVLAAEEVVQKARATAIAISKEVATQVENVIMVPTVAEPVVVEQSESELEQVPATEIALVLSNSSSAS